MSIYVSDQNKVLMLHESGTYANTSDTSGVWLGLVQSHDASENVNTQEIRYTGTASRNVGQFVNTSKDYEGALSLYPQDWRMLAFSLGSVVDAGSPSPYTHTISEANSGQRNYATSGTLSPFVSFSIHESKKGSVDGESFIRTYKGCVADSLTISASEGEPVSCEVAYKAQSVTLGSKTTDIINIASEDTSRPYVFSDCKLHLPSGTVIQTLKDFSFSVNNNTEVKHYLNGSQTAAIIVPTSRDYELSVTMDSDSTKHKALWETYFQDGGTFNTMLEISQSTGSEELFLIMSGCKLTEFSSPTPSEGIDEFSLTIKPQSVSANVNDFVERYNAW